MPVSAYTFLASVNCGIPASSGRPVGEPIVVVVVDVLVVDVLVVEVLVVEVLVVEVLVVDALVPVPPMVDVAVVARGDEEHATATTSNAVTRASRPRSTEQTYKVRGRWGISTRRAPGSRRRCSS
jgi:hypothetical protein